MSESGTEHRAPTIKELIEKSLLISLAVDSFFSIHFVAL